MNIHDKLTQLESMRGLSSLSDNDQQLIFEMCIDRNYEVRMRAAELLGEYPSNNVSNVLCSMLRDTDELVRATACESLTYCDLDDNIESLIQCTADKSPLVRGYAVLSLADFQNKHKKDNRQLCELFIALLRQEDDQWVKIALLRSLIVVGEAQYLEQFLKTLYDTDYSNQCFALTLLDELRANGIVSFTPCLREELMNLLSNSSSLAVRDKILKILTDTQTP